MLVGIVTSADLRLDRRLGHADAGADAQLHAVRRSTASSSALRCCRRGDRLALYHGASSRASSPAAAARATAAPPRPGRRPARRCRTCRRRRRPRQHGAAAGGSDDRVADAGPARHRLGDGDRRPARRGRARAGRPAAPHRLDERPRRRRSRWRATAPDRHRRSAASGTVGAGRAPPRRDPPTGRPARRRPWRPGRAGRPPTTRRASSTPARGVGDGGRAGGGQRGDGDPVERADGGRATWRARATRFMGSSGSSDDPGDVGAVTLPAAASARRGLGAVLLDVRRRAARRVADAGRAVERTARRAPSLVPLVAVDEEGR